MSDIIEYAEAALKSDCLDSALAVFVPPLIAELKAARAENERLRASMDDCTCPASSLFSGRPGRDCPAHGGGQ